MKKLNDHIKKLKKLSVKSGDIVIITLKGQPYPYDVDSIHTQFESMPFMKGVNIIITTDKVNIKRSKPKSGRHQVFLDNLEYLEYLDKHNGKGDL